MSLDNKTIFVGGGSTGIGRETVVQAHEAGANVVIADSNIQEGVNLSKTLNKKRNSTYFVKMDVSRIDEVKSAIEQTVEIFGQLDGAFNNAGIEGSFSNITKISEKEFDKIHSINLKGVWLSVKYQIIQMLSQNSGGSIVNTASVAGLVGTRGGTAYCASKHGVIGITKSAALEVAAKKIRINAICPGIVETPMLQRMISDTAITADSLIAQEPVGRLGLPREIANPTIWLLSDNASFITGAAFPVDGGYTAY